MDATHEYIYNEDGSVTKKLVGSRIARKQAEDDVKLLANRIALLKMEEYKVSLLSWRAKIHTISATY